MKGGELEVDRGEPLVDQLEIFGRLLDEPRSGGSIENDVIRWLATVYNWLSETYYRYKL